MNPRTTLAAVLLAANFAVSDGPASRPSDADVRPAPPAAGATVVGRLDVYPAIFKAGDTARPIRVWLPPAYDADPAARFDVLYLHDGQNCFDARTSAFGKEWRIDESLTVLIAAKKVRPLIVVAIDNGGDRRVDELTFTPDAKHGGGRGAAYASMLIDQVMPFIDKHYRTNAGAAHTLIGGASLGGLASLEIVRRHPGVFGGVIAMSPSLWWAGRTFLRDVAADPGGLRVARVWIDAGTREGDADDQARTVADVRNLDDLLAAAKLEHRLTVEPDAVHDENAWAKRFPEAIQYLAPP